MAYVDPSNSIPIRMKNAMAAHAMAMGPVNSTMEFLAPMGMNASPIASMAFVAAISARERVNPVRQPSKAADSMAYVARLPREPIPNRNARAAFAMAPAFVRMDQVVWEALVALVVWVAREEWEDLGAAFVPSMARFWANTAKDTTWSSPWRMGLVVATNQGKHVALRVVHLPVAHYLVSIAPVWICMEPTLTEVVGRTIS